MSSDKQGVTLDQIVASMRYFADVADRCDITAINSPASIRVWADQLAAIPTPPADAEQLARELLAAECGKPLQINVPVCAAHSAVVAALTQQPEPKPEARGVVDGVIDAVRKEIGRATAKFPTWPTDPLHACGVVQEESGELAKAVLQAVYEPHKSTPEDVATEALQTAAMAIRFLASMDRYDWKPGEQHQQGAALTEARTQQPDVRGAPTSVECNCPNGRAEHMTSCASVVKPEARGVVDLTKVRNNVLAVIPGGSICDPQQVADDVRAVFAIFEAEARNVR